MQAVFYNNLSAAKILLNNSTDPKIKSDEEKNALDYAVEYHLMEMTNLLLPYFKDQSKEYHQKALQNNFTQLAKNIRIV